MKPDSPRTLGIIPARGGSKRLPRKNLLPIHGVPLVAYTIRAAQAATKLTDFYVSTDDQEIATIAESYGARVIMRGPVPDNQTSGWALHHAVTYLDYHYDVLVLLHPTSPIRDPKHIDQAIDMLWASDAPMLASVECRKRTYTHNASIYAIKREFFTGEHYCDASIPFLMDRKHSIDIDTEMDLKIAEQLLNVT